MAEQWIGPEQALEIAKSPFPLCERLHAGLVMARARSLQMGDRRVNDAPVPKEFWWAEGRDALIANWPAGDFSTWIEQKTECRAYGVEISLRGVLELIPFEERANTARNLSVISNAHWVSAKEARRTAYSELGHNPAVSGEAILELARLGFVTGRAILAQGVRDSRVSTDWDWEEREWDIPHWFWDDFTHSDRSAQNWETGKFSGRGCSPSRLESITLTGVYFLRASLDTLVAPAPPPEPAEPSSRGRRPEYDWTTATSAIWGKLSRGELNPQVQADIEIALVRYLTKGEKEPSVSSARPYARPIWEEFQKP